MASQYDIPPCLKNLPPEIWGRDICSFLDGKALSTLFVAVLSHHNDPVMKVLLAVIEACARDRVEILHQNWQWHLGKLEAAQTGNNRYIAFQCRPYLITAMQYIYHLLVIQHQDEEAEADQERHAAFLSRYHHMKNVMISEWMVCADAFGLYSRLSMVDFRISENLAVSNDSRIRNELPTHGDMQAPVPIKEWPVWVGKIQVLLWVPRGIHGGVQRIMLEANVVILTPMFGLPTFITLDELGRAPQGERLIRNLPNNDNAAAAGTTTGIMQLVAEACGFVPAPPMGRLVGLSEKDKDVVRDVAARLSDQNTVAIIPISQDSRHLIPNMQMISRRQARQRIQNKLVPFDFYVQHQQLRQQHPSTQTPVPTEQNASETSDGTPRIGNDDGCYDLLCFWHARDVDRISVRDYSHYWKKFIENRQALLS